MRQKGLSISQGALHSFPASFRGQLLRPGDDAYHDVRAVWNGLIDKYPAFIARCTSAEDVVAAQPSTEEAILSRTQQARIHL